MSQYLGRSDEYRWCGYIDSGPLHWWEFHNQNQNQSQLSIKINWRKRPFTWTTSLPWNRIREVRCYWGRTLWYSLKTVKQSEETWSLAPLPTVVMVTARSEESERFFFKLSLRVCVCVRERGRLQERTRWNCKGHSRKKECHKIFKP